MSATIKHRLWLPDGFGSGSWEVVVLHADHLASHAYDEEKERALFNDAAWNKKGGAVGNMSPVEAAEWAWLACAKSRAKAAGYE